MLDGITTRNGQERPRNAKNRARPRAGSVAIFKSGDIPEQDLRIVIAPDMV